MSIQSFKIAIPQESLDDLQDRLARTRWTNELPAVGGREGIETRSASSAGGPYGGTTARVFALSGQTWHSQ